MNEEEDRLSERTVDLDPTKQNENLMEANLKNERIAELAEVIENLKIEISARE